MESSTSTTTVLLNSFRFMKGSTKKLHCYINIPHNIGTIQNSGQ